MYMYHYIDTTVQSYITFSCSVKNSSETCKLGSWKYTLVIRGQAIFSFTVIEYNMNQTGFMVQQTDQMTWIETYS